MFCNLRQFSWTFDCLKIFINWRSVPQYGVWSLTAISLTRIYNRKVCQISDLFWTLQKTNKFIKLSYSNLNLFVFRTHHKASEYSALSAINCLGSRNTLFIQYFLVIDPKTPWCFNVGIYCVLPDTCNNIFSTVRQEIFVLCYCIALYCILWRFRPWKFGK